MKKNVQKRKWLSDVLMGLVGGPGNSQESLLNLLNYMQLIEDYKAT
jgi:hypothetical protein